MNEALLDIPQTVQRALAEDVGSGDVSAALLPADLDITAQLISREPMVVAGMPWVTETFRAIDPRIQLHWEVREGDWLAEPRRLCTINGLARSVLTAERTALNFLQMLSGTATLTRRYVDQLRGTAVRLLDTRKTLPGFRYAQKYAVTCGGGMNHRMGLFDAYLIKENHIRALGSLSAAVQAARQRQDGLWIEVEVEDLTQLAEALLAKPDRILLDNFSLPQLSEAVKMNQPKVCALEASGGIGLDDLVAVAATGVDCIAVGALTKSVRAIDLSLLVE